MVSKPTPKLIWNEEHWLHRAEEARSIGESIRSHECKRIMDIVDSYARLAALTKAFQRAAASSVTLEHNTDAVRNH